MGRVAAIAIDAAEWWYLDRLLEAGKLPHLARLRDRAARAAIRSEAAYRSELVWARFLSGREPLEDKNWAVSVTFDPATYEVGINSASRAEPFYALGEGTEVVALDLIHSKVAEQVQGVQVVAWGAHSPQWPRSSSPPGLLRTIDERFGTNPAFDNDFDYGWHDPEFLTKLLAANRVGAERRTDIATWLLDEHPDWDLFLTCYSEFHSVGHQAWHGADERHPLHGVAPTSDLAGQAMEEIAVAVDEQLGRLLAAVGDDTTVVVFAMHGFQPADDVASVVLLPELLHRLHRGRKLFRDPDQRAWRRAGCPPVLPGPGDHIGSMVAEAFAATPKDKVRRALPPAVLARLRRAAGKGGRPSLSAMDRPTPPEVDLVDEDAIRAVNAPPSYEPAAWYRHAWPKMPYFALPSFADGHVRVNLRGRERDGLVDKEDYERTLDEIERVLADCRDARTGAPVVEDLLRLRSDDPFDPEGPDSDVLVIWSGAPDAFDHPTVGTIGPFPHMRTSHHSPDGFALVAGPGITPGDLGTRAGADLPPTVLSLLGRPIPSGMRGSSMLPAP